MQPLSPMATIMTLIIGLLTVLTSSQVINPYHGPGYYVLSNGSDVPPFELHYYGLSSDYFVCTASELQGNCVVVTVFNANIFKPACTDLTIYPEFTGKGLGSWAAPKGLEWECKGYTHKDCLDRNEGRGDWRPFDIDDMGGNLKGRAQNVQYGGTNLQALKCTSALK